MGQISETYASPGLRWGLLLEDHPEATVSFEKRTGAELGIPDEFGGDGSFCVATIDYKDGTTYTAWKPVPGKGDAEQWNVLCTKTLGRALKRAGYPDDMKDLKALVLWRQRNSEIAAIEAGHVQQQLGSGSQPALEAGSDPVARALEEAASSERGGAVGGDDVDVAEGDVMADQATVDTITGLVEGLSRRERANYDGFLSTIKAPADPAQFTEEQAVEVLRWLNPED